MPLIAALSLALLAPATSQAPPDPVTAPEPEAAPSELDFATEQDRMTLPVHIADSGPYAFIVDTGAQRTVISRQLAVALKLSPGRNVRMTAMTGTSTVATAIIPLITVGSSPGALGGSRIEAPMLEAHHLGADGLLGLDTLQHRTLTIDFDAQRMTVTAAAKRRRSPRAASDEIVVTARSVLGQLVVTDALYRGTKIRVVLDSGSAVTMGNLALQRRIGPRALAPITVTSVTGSVLHAGYTQVEEVSVGGIKFQNLPIAFADAAPFARFGLQKRPALLLGMDALRLFRRVDIDFANREVRFALPKGTRRI
ncbi:aspartyl protease family protein [Sphingomonas sp. PB4P5]|uniref:aspartyl protease family protein n=1 Tax=Parasphingomonas puruogangriensis TaxID=3096155 RepID=UPI002FC7BCEF